MTDLIPIYQDPFDLAEKISRSALIPQAYRGKPADAAICMMYGAEVGLPPMTALQRIVVINGRPTLDAQGMTALIRGAGHSLVGTTSDTEATVVGTRLNGDTMTVTFTIADAKRANLVKNGPWTQYPSAMLWARAVSKLARELFSDVLMGMAYVPEELDFSQPDSPPNLRGEGEPHMADSFPAQGSPPVADSLRAPPNVSRATGEIVDAEVVEVVEETPVADTPMDPIHELAGMKRELTAIIKSLPKRGDQDSLRAHLIGRFGSATKMTVEQVNEAITLAAGWPDNAPAPASEYQGAAF